MKRFLLKHTHTHIATHTLTLTKRLRSSSIVTVKLGYTRIDERAKINGHGIELGVPFRIDLRNRRSVHFTGVAYTVRKFDLIS